MDLAATIAEHDSDVVAGFTACGRLGELVDGFATASKAMALISGESRSAPATTKRLRETGWTPGIWSVRT